MVKKRTENNFQFRKKEIYQILRILIISSIIMGELFSIIKLNGYRVHMIEDGQDISGNDDNIMLDIKLILKSSSYDVVLKSRRFLMGMNPYPRNFNNGSVSGEEFERNLEDAYELGKSVIELYPRWPAINWTTASSDMPVSQFEYYKNVLKWQPMVYIKIGEYFLNTSESAWHIRPLLKEGMDPNLKFNDSEFINQVSDALISFCKLTPGPEILWLGNEINQIYELENNQTLLEYLDGINKVAQKIKMDPNIPKSLVIGATISLTQLIINISDWTPWTQNRLWILKQYNKCKYLDMVGINSYPFKIYKNPEDIPITYYQNLTNYISKPIWFTEIGWPSGSDYNSSKDEQARFLSYFINITSNMDIRAICWISMHDFATSVGFENYTLSWGLRDSESNPKNIWDLWNKIKQLEVVGPMKEYLIEEQTPSITMAQIFLIILIITGISVVISITIILIKKKHK
ncbi:MAG: glycosyl hydrolase [Candidatus Helarchaeota archaeon]